MALALHRLKILLDLGAVGVHRIAGLLEGILAGVLKLPKLGAPDLKQLRQRGFLLPGILLLFTHASVLPLFYAFWMFRIL